MERREALRRERTDCFERALELLYISRIPVVNILDFGCGKGETVRFLRETLGINAVGVDPFGDFSETLYLHKGSLTQLRDSYPRQYFDAIYSIEVFEHLADPRETLADLLYFLKPGGTLLINTGTQEYLAQDDPDQTYIDPLRRGHISIYSLRTLTVLAEYFGLAARFLGPRKYVVLLGPPAESGTIEPLIETVATLRRIGEWFPGLFREHMRLLHLEDEFNDRGVWALQLERQLNETRLWAEGLDRQLKERGEWALGLDKQLDEKGEYIRSLQGELARQNELIRLERASRGPFAWRRYVDFVKRLRGKLAHRPQGS
jgi:SAM-dependent methyltransferase